MVVNVSDQECQSSTIRHMIQISFPIDHPQRFERSKDRGEILERDGKTTC